MSALILKHKVFKTIYYSASKTCSIRDWGNKIICRTYTWKERVGGNSNSPGVEMATPVRLAYVSYENIRPTMIVDKPPVIIMHEVLDSKDHWQVFAEHLHTMTLRRVYSIDMRNHGDSYHSKSMDFYQMSDDLKAFMDELNITEAILIGDGMGGRVALEMTLRYPLAVDRIVVVNASPTKMSEYQKKIGNHLITLKKMLLPSEYTSMSLARKHVYERLSKEVTDDLARFIITQNLVRFEDDGKPCLKWRVNLDTLIEQFKLISQWHVVQKSAKPMAFLHGPEEKRFTKDEIRQLRLYFPNALFVRIPGAGHFVQSEDPENFMTFIMSFLKMKNL